MKEKGTEWERFFKSREAEGLGGSLRALAQSAELQKLNKLLVSKGERAQNASEEAIRGDTRAFEALLSELSQNPEGAQVIGALRARIGR